MLPPTRTRWVTFDCFGTLINGESWPAARPFDDIEPLLAALRRHAYRLAVLTNCDDALFEKTHRMFQQPFDLFVTSERVRAYKPAPWHFRAFQLLTGVRKCEWVHVSADWQTDIVPAASLGIHRVWLDRKRSGEDARRASAHVYRADDVAGAVEYLFQERSARAS